MNIIRAATNPLITPADVTPSTPEMVVVGAFNPAAVRYGDETLLLMRVAEKVSLVHPDEVAVPTVTCSGSGEACMTVQRFSRQTPGIDLSDSRFILIGDRVLLTSLSHLRLARSRDGVNFTVDELPAIFPCQPYEEYGLEDPRITRVGDVFYINYTAVSRWGIGVALASTRDFITYTRHGLMFTPDNKDVAIFPEKIAGRYYALHRPSIGAIGDLQIWLSSSPDLLHWGCHRPLIGIRADKWDGLRLGAGDVPMRTEAGWLTIYHGVNQAQGYCLGALLLDLDDPSRVLARSEEPLLVPEMSYECAGFFGKVVFTCGSVLDDKGLLHIYYGAADEHCCCATLALDELLERLTGKVRL